VTGPWTEAVALLDAHDEVALVCHVGPDGDALGSMLALGLALQARGTKVRASWGSEPFDVPTPYRGLPGLDLLVPASEIPEAPGLLITFDTGSVDRLGSLADRVPAAQNVLVIDHHASNTRFGTVNAVDESAASTASMVVDLIDALGLPLTADVAAPSRSTSPRRARRSARASPSPSTRRPSAAWGRRAASSSTCRTAPTAIPSAWAGR